MKLAVVYTRSQQGIHAPLVTVEVHLLPGLPNLFIVGLPEAVVKESKDRVRSAIVNSKLAFPKKRIIINLAPVDLPKSGGGYDLPIALGILAASEQIPLNIMTQYEFAGELALSGELRAIKGALPFAISAIKDERNIILPKRSAIIASCSGNNRLYGAENLIEVYEHLCNISPICQPISPSTINGDSALLAKNNHDLSEIKGQHQAKRALLIAAAGGHNLLMIGPPGTGKTMLANRLPGIMPELTDAEALEVATIASITSSSIMSASLEAASPQEHNFVWKERPFRMPHHTATAVAIAGGGSIPKPGEVSLAHNGILFMDELPEFNKRALEVLREPMSSGFITISRAKAQEKFPAQFQLIAAMNPCPCGQLTNPYADCNCTSEQVRKYLSKISGPILDRIDLHVEVPYISTKSIASDMQANLDTTSTITTSSATAREHVSAARMLQIYRCSKINALLTNKEVETFCQLTPEAKTILLQATDKFHLSARSYFKVIKIAQTIADLAAIDGSATPAPDFAAPDFAALIAIAQITPEYIAEALNFRVIDKQYKGLV